MFDTERPPDAMAPAAPVGKLTALDVNFLPERYRPRRLRFAMLRPWLVLLAFGALLVPSVQLFSQRTAELHRIQAQQEAVSSELDNYQPLANQRDALQARIDQAQLQIGAIEDAYDIINIQLHTWSALLPRVLAAAPDQLYLGAVTQSDLQITLEGYALSYALPSAYADRLEALGEFESVEIQLIARLAPQDEPPIFVPTATPEASSGSDSESATPEAEPAPIYQFEIQLALPAPRPTPAPTEAGG